MFGGGIAGAFGEGARPLFAVSLDLVLLGNDMLASLNGTRTDC